MESYPEVDYPTILEGVVYGTALRLESKDGSQLWLSPADAVLPGITWRSGKFILTNFGPITDFFGQQWGVTHLQYKSRHGWLKVSPECFHRWAWLKMKKFDANGKPISGSELGLYFRKGFALFTWMCWRWDVVGTVLDGVLRHWIPSEGFWGGHWD